MCNTNAKYADLIIEPICNQVINAVEDIDTIFQANIFFSLSSL